MGGEPFYLDAENSSKLRRSASKVLDAKPFALRFLIALYPEDCSDKGPEMSDLHLSRGLLSSLDAIGCP